MKVRTGMNLAALLAVLAVAVACTGTQSAAPSVSPSADELTGVRIDVYETPD